MRLLVLFRHAKAESRLAGGKDFDRPLTRRGHEDAAKMGRLIVEEGMTPDLALISCARRARETWTSARAAFPDARFEMRDALYNATAEEIASELRTAPATAATVMVVGHNPGLQELAVDLLTNGGAPATEVDRLSSHFPTATVAALRIDADGKAALEGVFHARDRGGQDD